MAKKLKEKNRLKPNELKLTRPKNPLWRTKGKRASSITTTLICDALGKGEFVKLFPKYKGQTLKFNSRTSTEIDIAVAQWLFAHGKI